MMRERLQPRSTIGVGSGWLMVVAMVLLGACQRDPLDPRGELEHHTVNQIEQAEQRGRSRGAYERARRRVANVRSGQSAEEVDAVLGAVVVAEHRDDENEAENAPRAKVVEGFLCTVQVSLLRQRRLFGYDDGGVVLIGFAIEFERDDPEDDDWIVRRVDMDPDDDCPGVE